MGWLGPGGHDGWAVPLFADGAAGNGGSGPAGILIARRPGGNPHNGDRVLLSYPDGSSVEGLWQDDVVLGGDGGVYAHTRGAVRREVLEEAEQWRPDAAVVGWAAGCDCGWRGRAWTRVQSSAAAGWTGSGRQEDVPVVDGTSRLIFQPGDYADLEGAAEEAVRDDWRAHVAPYTTLADVEDAVGGYAAAGRALDGAVRAARAAGASWADIGRVTGMSRQSAHARWRDEEQPPTWTASTWWNVEVQWDGETHTAERPFGLFTEAQAWCAATITELFRDGAPEERAAADAMVDRIDDMTGESREYLLTDTDLAVEVRVADTGDPRNP